MSLVVRMMTPPMHKPAVLLAIVTPLVLGGAVVIVDWIAVAAHVRAAVPPATRALAWDVRTPCAQEAAA